MKSVSLQALSQQLPFRLIELHMPQPFGKSRNSPLAYWARALSE
jgi:hypothetical protein